MPSDRKRVSIYLTDLEYDRLRKLASDNDVSMSCLLGSLIIYYRETSGKIPYSFDFKHRCWHCRKSSVT